MFKTFTRDINIGNSVITLETGFMANQADGSVLARCGGTTVLCVVCTAKEDSPDVDFFPLTVNYIEKAYACGKIPSGFFKREGKQSEREILISRLIDRPIRPIFVDGYYRNTQIICTLLSFDGINEPDMVALVGASAAVAIAGLPTQGVISGCRIGYINGEYIVNPDIDELKKSKLDLVVAGTTDAVLMVESEANILSEDEMLGAIEVGQKVINSSVEQIKEFAKEVNKKPAVEFYPRNRDKLYEKMKELVKESTVEAFKIQDKHKRHETLNEIFNSVNEKLLSEQMECDICDSLVYQNNEPIRINQVDIKLMFEKLQEEIVRGQIMKDKVRIDGRSLDQIRQIDVRVGVLPVVHGSAVFSRGLTQVMAVATLGTSQDEQMCDSLTDSNVSQRFMLHYNFPGYSAGEATAPKAPGRRELGHGNLARRALNPVIPSKEDFPYSIRVVGEVLSSDGSTSQATVCSSCMALIDMGVPLKAPVAGIAMGLIKEKDGYEVLTDIMADEDHLGDMDFKVAGPLDGITALQMDIKTFGITIEIMRDALAKAKKAREYILSKMMAVASSASKCGMNKNAPKVYNMVVPENKISDIIGKGGLNIKKICETSKAKIDVTQEGNVTIFASNQDELDVAKEMIEASIGKIEFGRIFDAVVKSVMDFGVIVDVGYNRTGLVHISELSNEGFEPSVVVKEGQLVKVKFIGSDNKGRFKFSLKAVNQETGEDISNGEYSEQKNEKMNMEHKNNKKKVNFKRRHNSENNTKYRKDYNRANNSAMRKKNSKKKSSGFLSIFKKNK